MKNPYKILGIDEQADDATVKQAYLQQVKRNPPDRNQAYFQQIHQAYESLKDRQSRVKYALFENSEADFGELLDAAFTGQQTPQLSAGVFGQLLSVGVNENTFRQVISTLAARQLQQFERQLSS